MADNPIIHPADSRQSPMAPLDGAAEYIRDNYLKILPPYILAMAPFAAAALFAIQTIASQHRSAEPAAALLLLAATLWRWAFVGLVQRRVQADIRSESPLPILRRIPGIMMLRLVSNVLALWGVFLVAPTFYGLLLGGFAAPMLLEEDGRIVPVTWKSLVWINESSRRLFKLMAGFGALFFIVTTGVFVLQYFVTSVVFTSLMGLNVSGLELTLSSYAWFLSMMCLIYLAFDFFWTVGAVMVFYDLRARRLGSDIRASLKAVQEVGG